MVISSGESNPLMGDQDLHETPVDGKDSSDAERSDEKLQTAEVISVHSTVPEYRLYKRRFLGTFALASYHLSISAQVSNSSSR